MDALDGNAIAGRLRYVFGSEMTTVHGICGGCGVRLQVAELRVYVQAPGTVVRCPTCDSVVMVMAEIRGITCVDLQRLEMLEPAGLTRSL